MSGINLAIHNFKESLTKTINESGLPPGVLEPIVAEAHRQLRNQNLQAVEYERQALEKEALEKEVDKDGICRSE